MKTHLSFATSDLDKSVAFYRVLFDAKPTKLLRDYALFVVADPAMELALDLAPSVTPVQDAHFGICVDSTQDVESAAHRLASEGLVSSIERSETCCYANQTKVWAADPEGRRWEVYTVHEETQERNDNDTQCCSGSDEDHACCLK